MNAHKYGTDFMAHQKATATINGTVSYRERIALPKNSAVEVTLWSTLPNKEPEAVSSTTIITQGENVPIPFTLEYNPGRIRKDAALSLSASITNNGAVTWTTSEAVSVTTDSTLAPNVTLNVQQASKTSTPTKSSPTSGSTSTKTTGTTTTSTNLMGTYRLVTFNTTKMEPGENYTVDFGEKGKIAAKFCNSMSGTYKVKGSTVSAQMLSTLMYCGEPAYLAGHEQGFNKSMAEGMQYTIKDKTLTLKGKNGDVLVFEKI